MLALSFTVSHRGQQGSRWVSSIALVIFWPELSLSQLGLFANPFPRDLNSFQNVFSKITHALWENPRHLQGRVRDYR